jgi:hypothetical protein
MTEKQILKAAKQCADGLGCTYCPLEESSSCTNIFANYIKIKEEPASVAADTDSKSDMYENKSHKNNNTPAKKSQVLLNTILELADDIISDDNADTEIAGYAGTIKGLTYSLRELIGGADNG